MFTDYLYTNQLTFSDEINPNSINYLDITLFNEDKKIITRNFFKKVDCNSLLNSITATKESDIQIFSLANSEGYEETTRNTDYFTQSQILKRRFKDKKYPLPTIQGHSPKQNCYHRNQVSNLKLQVRRTIKKTKDFQHTFITMYNYEHRQVENILSKHFKK